MDETANEKKSSNLKNIQKKLQEIKRKSDSKKFHLDTDGIDFGEER